MIKITKPAKIIIAQENLDLSIFSGIGASLESITPDQKVIPSKNNRKDTPAVSILRK